MSTNHDRELEARLRGMLTDQAEYVEVTADLAGPAIARRRRDQRRTMIGAAVAAVAALAIVVPTIGALLPEQDELLPAGPTSSEESTAPGQPSGPATTDAPGEEPSGSAPSGTTAANEANVLSPEQIATTLAPFSLGSTLHLPTGSFVVGEGVEITGFVTLKSLEGIPNGNAVVTIERPDLPEAEPEHWFVPVLSDAPPTLLGAADLVVSQDGSVFTLGDGTTIRVLDSDGTLLGSQSFADHTVLAVDDTTVYSFDALTWGETFQAWDYRSGAVTETTQLPALTSSDGRFTAQYSIENREIIWRLRDLTTGQTWEEGSTETLQTFTPVRFSADGAYLYSARGTSPGGIHRTSDGEWLSPEAVDPTIWGYTPTIDGTGLLVVMGANNPNDDNGQSWLATCDFDFTGCRAVTDKVDFGRATNGTDRANVHRVATQH